MLLWEESLVRVRLGVLSWAGELSNLAADSSVSSLFETMAIATAVSEGVWVLYFVFFASVVRRKVVREGVRLFGATSAGISST